MFRDSDGNFRIEEVRAGAMTIMALYGELDITGQPHLMAEVDRVLGRGQRFFLIRGEPQIDRLLAAAGLDGYFDMVNEPDHLPDGSLTIASGL